MILKKRYIVALHDIVLSAISFVAAIYLRLGEHTHSISDAVSHGVIIFSVISGLTFIKMGLDRSLWNYTSFKDLIQLVKAVTYTEIIFTCTMFFFTRLEEIPRSSIIINWMLLIILIGTPRLLYRAIKEKSFSLGVGSAIGEDQIPVILAGINQNAELFLRKTLNRKDSKYVVVGIIDNDKSRHGSKFFNIKVYGDFNSLNKTFAKLVNQNIIPKKVILTSDQVDGVTVRNLLEIVDSVGLTLARLPNITDLKNTVGDKLEIKPIVIEDLLGRPENSLDKNSMRQMINGKAILVTGGGGTIGSELVKQIASYGPKKLIIIDNTEHNLYLIETYLRKSFEELNFVPYIADIRNYEKIDYIFSQEKPQIVFHAAALKHVPIVENNIVEGVLTNVFGTVNIADLCKKHHVSEMVMISTDKAVNPTNVMGATKRIAENYINALSSGEDNNTTKFVTVRFGNVLGSSGSVIPLFEAQLKSGGPLTVTHPDMVRYFMTVQEAVELVLQASVLGLKGDNKSAIYVLDMGEPVRIYDLAVQMIKMAGLRVNKDIRIEFSGIRSGEKLFEELFYSYENLLSTEYKSILLASAKVFDFTNMKNSLQKLEEYCTKYDNDNILSIINLLVPEYVKFNKFEEKEKIFVIN